MDHTQKNLIDRIPPNTLYRVLAFAEMVTWAGLITAMVMKYSGIDESWVPIAGGIHGFVFLSYSVTTVFVWVNQKWKTSVGLLGLGSAIIPFLTVPFEMWLVKRNLLVGEWRLAPGRDKPEGFIEKAQALVLKFPISAIALGIVLIGVVFTMLLILGPPIPVN